MLLAPRVTISLGFKFVGCQVQVSKDKSIKNAHSCFHDVFPHLFIGQLAAMSKTSLVIGRLLYSFDTSRLSSAFVHVASTLEILGL